MNEKEPQVIVIGGVNCDISGTPAEKLRMGDSNPGRITLTPGGVGRNIAENLVRLGRRVSMITALGSDANGDFIRNSCRSLGIGLSLSFTFPEEHTSTYLCLNDRGGEVVGAIADMEICCRLTPELLAERLPQLRQADMIVMDANLPPESIRFVAENVTCPLFADPVSVAKAGRLLPSLGFFTMIKPNVPEASLLTGIDITVDGDLDRAAEILLARGMKLAVISLGGRGVYWNDGRDHGIEPCLPMPVRNTNGCGDALLAACASACLDGLPVKQMIRFGLAASAVCAQSDSAVSPELSCQRLLDCLEKYGRQTD